VTGSLGGRAAVRLALEAGLSIPYRLKPPVPRVSAGRALAIERLAHAMMDISDGLAGDLSHLCSASGVGAVIREESLPIGTSASELAPSLHTTPAALALGGGEDYELLVALPPASLERAQDAVGDVGLTVIGQVLPPAQGISLERRDGSTRALTESGWRHF
jgi:thiamine-monophosphate kinase